MRTGVAVIGGDALQDAAVLHERRIVLRAVLEQQLLAAARHGHGDDSVVGEIDGASCHEVAEVACGAVALISPQFVDKIGAT